MKIAPNLKRLFSSSELYLFLVIALIVTVVSQINPRFLSAENLFDLLRSYSFIGILSIGFLVVLISGGIDISFTATATVAQYILALMLVSNFDLPIIVILIIPIMAGTLLGSLNAILIHYLNAPSIIITIATLNAYYGILQFISKGRWIYNFPDWFRAFPNIILIKFVNQDGVTYGFSIMSAVWLLIAIAGFILLRYMRLGRYIYAKGGNLEGAKRAGLNIFRMRLFAYSFLGCIAGIGAIAHAMLTQTVAPNALLGQEFDVLTAVVLGGASIFGGSGSVIGSMLGVGLVALIKNALTLTRVPEYWHQVFIGLILMISVSITAIQSKIARSKKQVINVS